MLNTTNPPCFLMKLLVPSFQEMFIFYQHSLSQLKASKKGTGLNWKGALRLILSPCPRAHACTATELFSLGACLPDCPQDYSSRWPYFYGKENLPSFPCALHRDFTGALHIAFPCVLHRFYIGNLGSRSVLLYTIQCSYLGL